MFRIPNPSQSYERVYGRLQDTLHALDAVEHDPACGPGVRETMARYYRRKVRAYRATLTRLRRMMEASPNA